MRQNVIKIIGICSVTIAILLLPLSHIGKRYVGSSNYYSHITAAQKLTDHFKKDNIVLVLYDAYLPPLLTRYVDYVRRDIHPPTYVLFPPLLGKHHIEKELWEDLIKKIVEDPNRKILCAAQIQPGGITDKKAHLQFKNNTNKAYILEFDVDEVVYSFHDGAFFIGRLVKIVNKTDNKNYYPPEVRS